MPERWTYFAETKLEIYRAKQEQDNLLSTVDPDHTVGLLLLVRDLAHFSQSLSGSRQIVFELQNFDLWRMSALTPYKTVMTRNVCHLRNPSFDLESGKGSSSCG